MKKWTFIISLLLSLSFIMADQLNLVLDNSLQYSGQSETTLEEILTLTLSYKNEINDNMDFVAGGWAEYSNQEEKEDRPAYADLQKFYLSWNNANSTIDLNTGRMRFADTTGYVLNEILDGLQAKFSLQELYRLNISLGFSGLTNDQFSTLAKTREEYLLDQYLSPQRLIWQAKLMREEPSGMKYYLGGLGQIGLEEVNRDYLSWYLNAGSTLPVSDFIIQTHYSYNGGFMPIEYSGSTEIQNISSHFIFASINYYPHYLRHKGLNMALSGLYSSGEGYDQRLNTLPGAPSVTEPSGTSTLFTPISKTTMGSLMETIPGNLIRSDLTLSFIPVKGSFGENIVEVSGGTALYMRPVHGPVNVSGLNPNSTDSYLATEVRGKLIIRPFSDISVSLSASLLLPDTSTGGAFEGSRESMEWDSGLYVSWLF